MGGRRIATSSGTGPTLLEPPAETPPAPEELSQPAIAADKANINIVHPRRRIATSLPSSA